MPFNPDKPYTLDRIFRILLSLAAVLAGLWFLDYLSPVLIPFALAWVVAYMINPLVLFFQNTLRVRKRAIAVLLSLVTVIAAGVSLLVLVLPIIGREITHMGTLLSKAVNNGQIEAFANTYFPEGFEKFFSDFAAREEVTSFFNTENILNLARESIPGVWGIFTESIGILIGLAGVVIVLLYIVFILMEYRAISQGWKVLIPHRYRQRVIQVTEDVNRAMNGYFRAQALIAFIVGVLFALGFWIIGLPMGIALGLFIGLLNMVPYLQTIGLVPALFFAAMYSLENGTSFWTMIGLVALVFAVVQLIQEAILTPKIMGKSTGLNAAVILLSLSVWGYMLGFLGLIIAIPGTYLLLSYYKRFLHRTSTGSA